MPHRSRWRPSLITAAAGVLLALVLLGATVYSLWREHRELTADATDRVVLLARVLEDHASRSFDAAQIALAGLADAAERGAPPDVLQALLDQTQASLPFLRGVALVNDAGLVLAAADPADRGARIDPTSLGAWPVPGRDSIGGFVPARSLAGLGPDRAAVPAGVGFIPVLRGVHLPGAAADRPALLVALINPDALANFQQMALNDAQAAAALVALDGRLLAATSGAEALPGQRLERLLSPTAPVGRVRGGSEYGGWSGPGLREDEQIGAYRALRARPLAMLVELPQEEVQHQWFLSVRDLGLPAFVIAMALVALSMVGAAALRARERAALALDQAQRQIVEREHELSAIFGSVQDLLFRTDARGHVTFINEGYAQQWGHDVQRVLGRPLQDLFGGAPSVAALFEPSHGAVPQPRQAHADWMSPEGRAFSFEIHVVPLRRGPDQLEWVGSAADVSSLMQAQAELSAQLGLARSLLASSPLPMSVLDRENRYVDVNRAWEQFTGRSRGDVLGRRAASYLRAEEAAAHDARDAALLANGGELSYEAVWHAADGRRRDLFISKATFPDAQGRPAGIVVCFMDISDFREAERATRAARDAAVESSRAKSDFIANVSHELRTPLQSILGFSELGTLRSRHDPRLAEMFADVHRAGQRMLSLVNDLLDLSKIERGAEPLTLQRLDLRPLAIEVTHELSPLLAARRLELEANLGDGLLLVMADPPRLQQLVRNLLANAIRFSPEGGRIELVAGLDERGDVRIEVADRGPGIPPDELESIFEAFVQSSATRSAAGGTGLGLAICRRLARAHGGRIWAANRVGGGAVITLVLPAAQLDELAA
ncbi:sensor histidine kinase [Roseateles cellulosilyticus]|uniref:histidine kinase n=1 Tax=Pelomonas cellulosilytica TaxID=2906762 RepID=A0ABS8XTZ8_9BURK|nr:PAS domain-containing sensor histidine kinase [Pelomonas sp. P8]MCE4554203.1 PAS domain-containing sensor histidine kinase [Pelomonas sp. P8]